MEELSLGKWRVVTLVSWIDMGGSVGCSVIGCEVGWKRGPTGTRYWRIAGADEEMSKEKTCSPFVVGESGGSRRISRDVGSRARDRIPRVLPLRTINLSPDFTS